ncbi:hypothetical protein BpHYR1_015812 [Brachionus plicatilis]|uniref:Uncharacterized protein n=1 Tax=Brachionus plicatilis TaxID=10195 RepID=A0A3M7QWP1_BRAPC|nr:hypothetical protein BpHYR1_015812 [Brachionus plicatilis]
MSANIFGFNVSNVLDTGDSRSMIKKECLNKIPEIEEPGSLVTKGQSLVSKKNLHLCIFLFFSNLNK